MPVQDYGLVPFGLGVDRTLSNIANLKMEQQRTNAFSERNALLDREMQAEQSAAAQMEDARRTWAMMQTGDQRAVDYAIARAAEADPRVAELPRDVAAKVIAIELEKQFGKAEQAPAPDYRTVGGALVEITPEGPREVYRPAQRAPLPRAGSAPSGAPAMPGVAPMGKPPPGYRWTPDGSLEAIPGGPAAAKGTEETAKREAAFRLYEAGMTGLLEGLKASRTGPVVGRLPAMTPEQQAAESGVAAMAPILKQLFRVAGEGVFTDKDQELLLKMIPTRTMLPKARDQQIANIDAIVRAKLGMAGGTNAPTDPLAQYAGQVIVQNGKRYQVMQGRDGKYFAQEVK